jgi:hypothetical protein
MLNMAHDMRFQIFVVELASFYQNMFLVHV